MRLGLRAAARAAMLLCRAMTVLLLGCAGARLAAAAEDAVLLASTAPGYAPGMVVAAGDRLLLPDAASVTLLLRSGELLRLRGPLETSLGAAVPARNPGSAAAMAAAFRSRGVDASVIGGTRANAVAQRRPPGEDVTLDPQRSGTYCVGPNDTVWLARPTGNGAGMELRRRGNTRSIAWPSGATRVEWPSDVQTEDGDRFEVLSDGKAVAVLTVRLRKATGLSEGATIAEAVLLGCHEQYETALRRLARLAVPPELWLTTDRGRQDPVYRSGEPIGLVAMANVDGWLYCIVEYADGTATPAFPAGAIDGARLPGAVPVALQGHRRSISLLAGPRGVALVHCWLADRDIAAELPRALLDASGSQLPGHLARELDGVFVSVPASRTTKATVEFWISN